MELYFVLSIIERRKAQEMIRVHHDLNLSLVLAAMGAGTATSEHLSLYNLEPSEKAIIGTVATGATVKKLISHAEQKLYIDVPGNGVMMSIPMKSVSGGATLSHITEGQTLGGEKPNMDFKHELIIVVLKEGYSDMVMDSARKAGATGGTVLHAKGTGRAGAEKFHGVSLADEKDMIYILALSEKKSDIMKAITAECGAGTAPGAICFSLPVSETCGLRHFKE